MNEADVRARVAEALEGTEVPEGQFAALAGSLVWRMGRLSDESPVMVRVGLTQSVHLFADLPRLRNATDQELDEAVAEGTLRVEWVGPRP